MNLPSTPIRQNASAVVIAVILLGIMTTLIVGNSLALRHLKSELNLLDAKQIKNAGHPPFHTAINTNMPPRRPAP